MQRQADAYTPEELHALFQVWKEGGKGGEGALLLWLRCFYKVTYKLFLENLRI